MKFLLIILGLTACSQFVKTTDEEYFSLSDSKNNTHFQILFSHNINGETHPCGCRKFPLGGLPQANGIIKSESKKHPSLYVDVGDTLFESTTVPNFIKDSSLFKAKKIAEALDLLGLKIMTPGDQDFAVGIDFLAEIASKVKFDFLLSNAKDELGLKHKKLIHFSIGTQELFFIGVLNPILLKNDLNNFFIDPQQAIKKQLKEINNIENDPNRRTIILLSHSGLAHDEELAKIFPQLDWIIGAHSQSYLRHTKDINKTKIVQVLSRNHFIGEIEIPLHKQGKYDYKMIESRDETKGLITENSMNEWLLKYKTAYDQIQKKEQEKSSLLFTEEHQSIPTYISCSDCHKKQVRFWQQTEHALAYVTLHNTKASHNSSCIKCHSVGHNLSGGFSTKNNMIIAKNGIKFNPEQYWKDFSKHITIKKSVRSLTNKQRLKYSEKWLKFDVDRNIAANYANVQCLNCHIQDAEHPFGDVKSMAKEGYQSKCLTCHTRDQSPEWYNKDTQGLASSVNNKYFSKKLKEVSCPKIER